ncbi:TetR/AcrR family transcriptional regulator C-terminal ligand-binding domain-containing protein [Nonomuraea sp. CA-141351]|uniref:TetR/AcrR family transcriptional regulator n=1 Tax=Nonomuraea sp. CA-141351 TaxID=3239996 RepID=UPI003D8EB3E3
MLSSALELAEETASRGFTMEELAARAAVSKRTLYRWWSCRSEVLAEALVERARIVVEVPATSNAAADLRSYIRSVYLQANAPEVAAALRLLMADAQTSPVAAASLRFFTSHRRDACLDLLSRAQEHGTLSAGLDPGVMADVILGVVWYRLLTEEPTTDDAAADEVHRLLTGEH